MFCPNCGSENDAEKKYCRKCGQPLAAVWLAMEGRVDEAIKTLDGHQRLSGHRVRLGIGVFLIIVAVATIFTGGKFGFSNVQSAAFVLIFIVLFFLLLARKSHHVARVLDIENQTEELRLSQSIKSSADVIGGQKDIVNPAEPGPAVVVEQDTLKLKPKDHLPQG